MKAAIEGGPRCLMLRCPSPKCRAAVGEDMIKLLASDELNNKYLSYLLRSYVENNRKIKWCPAPGCEFAVDFVAGSRNNYDVSCLCSYSFCWNCSEEAHRPVDCDTVSKWILKNNSEADNTVWILAYTKPCPKCKKPIQKNQGCNHMTCWSHCGYEFCWLCLGDYRNHDYTACNTYRQNKKKGILNEEDRRREMAKIAIDRYTHYYERWASNDKSREKAIADLDKMENQDLEKLSVAQSQPVTQLKFIIEAWLQIIECRRVLKWTYAYGYYIPQDEPTKKEFFDYVQSEANNGLERLHDCAEKELQQFYKSPSEEFDDYRRNLQEFNDFRTKLAGLTSVTKTYFENLVKALENGLEDVDSNATSSKTVANKDITLS